MIIENRHKKQYSEKVFNELCILYLLMDNNNVLDAYVLTGHFMVSKRTLYRYVEDINTAWPIINLHFEGNSKHKYLCAEIPEEYDNDLAYYISKTYDKAEINDERLCRRIKLLTRNQYCLTSIDDIDEEDLDGISPSEIVLINDEKFVFADFDTCDELYKITSLRTQQRDVRLIKQVLIKMKEMD